MTTTSRPEKPTPDFPLFPHANGQWAKKIKGKAHYFGPWEDPESALAKFIASQTPGNPGERLNSERATSLTKKEIPAKPYADFPLTPHPNGQWAKKINGKLHYFGCWADPQAALDKYLVERDDPYAGRDPAARKQARLHLYELVNRFLASKEAQARSDELGERSLADYTRDCKKVIEILGSNAIVERLSPSDFERLRSALAEKLGPVTLGNTIGRIRVFLKYAHDQHLIPAPVRYGQSFKRPRLRTLRRERRKKGKRMFEAKQIRQMLTIASREMKTMILLAINCGFGNHDCATLTLDHLDLDAGYHQYHRTKTEVDRMCPLWPETVEALRDVIQYRRQPSHPEHARLVFVTKYGNSWEGSHSSTIGHQFSKTLVTLGIKRPGLGFYALRHTVATVGERTRDHIAVKFIMGHAPASDDMAAVYREEMDDERLRYVSNYVRDWLFSEASD